MRLRTRHPRAAAAAILLCLTLLPVGPTVAQDTGPTDDRHAMAREARAAAMAAQADTRTSTRAPEWGSVHDSPGDVVNLHTGQVETFPRADIRSARMRLTERTFRLELSVEEAVPLDPAVDSGWLGATGAYVAMDTVGDQLVDHELFLFHDPDLGAVFDVVRVADDRLVCRDRPRLDGAHLLYDVAICLGTPAQVSWDVTMYWDVDPPGEYLPDYGDFAGDPPGRTTRMEARPATRIFGTDRISTALAISQHVYTEPTDRVLLVNADAPADALASGQIGGGPVLLVPGCGPIPEAVHAEIQRLDPLEVVALGGEAVVCTQHLQDAAELPDGWTSTNPDRPPEPAPEPEPEPEDPGPTIPLLPDVLPPVGGDPDPDPEPEPDPEPARRPHRRIAGPDRFATTAALVAEQWDGYTHQLGIAGGTAFADAAAAPAGLPVLLVPSCGPVPDVVREQVERLDPTQVVALGGTAAVCEQTLQEVAAGRETRRWAGRDRYETSAVVSLSGASNGGAVQPWVASGQSITDALLAGRHGYHTLLLPPCGFAPRRMLQSFSFAESEVTVVGGPSVLCDDVVVDLASAPAR